MRKNVYKKMCIYRIHRSNQLDHEKGRPAILLKYKSQISLVWTGTHKEDQSKEVALSLNINGKATYFYAKGIEKMENIYFKGDWIDFKTYKAYELSTADQKLLISKFVEFTNQEDPYQKIMLLELENEVLQKEVQLLTNENERLKELLQDEYEFE